MKAGVLLCLFFLIANCSFGQLPNDREKAPAPSQQKPDEIKTKPDSLDLRKEERIEVSKDKLPSRMLEELSKNPKYEGWEAGNAFFEYQTGQYLIGIEGQTGTTTFRFDKEGRPLQQTGTPTTTEERN